MIAGLPKVTQNHHPERPTCPLLHGQLSRRTTTAILKTSSAANASTHHLPTLIPFLARLHLPAGRRPPPFCPKPAALHEATVSGAVLPTEAALPEAGQPEP